MSLKDTLIARESEKPGFRGRINAKCIDCIYDPEDVGTWRQQVEACRCDDCPLHPIRPVSEKAA